MKKLLLAVAVIWRIFCETFAEDSGISRSYPPTLSCGIATRGVGYIVGGKKIEKGDYPW